MLIRKLRLEQGWSQEHLAEISGLSVRTIQRVERGQTASMETVKALASVFQIEYSEISGELQMSNANIIEVDNPPQPKESNPENTNRISIEKDEAEALRNVRDIKGFYSHLIKYVVVIGILFVIDILTGKGINWFYWPALGWGIGIVFHGLSLFEKLSFFGTDWERKQVEKRLRKRRR
ncbi:MAG: helix-turn-helix domain-containing protein [Gammaproteobacteria bacterium]|mgnify:CR=1 FL=1|nr:MAG: helix-turn-helix domain-containing protein [Gammaproteobacteria bacterium]